MKVTQLSTLANQVLDDKKVKLYSQDKLILKSIGRIFDTTRKPIGFRVGKSFIERGNTIYFTNHNDVIKAGFCVIGIRGKGFFAGQKMKYALEPYSSSKKHVKVLPSRRGKHYVEYDESTRSARLLGRNAGRWSVGEWVTLNKQHNIKKKKKCVADFHKDPDDLLAHIEQKLTGSSPKSTFNKINGIPLIFTIDNELVCLPNEADEPSILVLGSKRSGKSYFLHGLADRTYWNPYWPKRLAIINDSLRECGPWVLPNFSHKGMFEMRKINETPIGLPCVFLHPNVIDFKDGDILHPGLKITLPFEEVIGNLPKYFQLGKSSSYYEKFKQEILESDRTLDSIYQILIDNEVNQGTINKVMSFITQLYDAKVVDANTGISGTWKIEHPEFTGTYNPFTASVLAGIVPVLETSHLLSTPYFEYYFKYFIEDIFNRQSDDEIFRRKNIQTWLFADELLNIACTELGKKSMASDILTRVVTEGGPKRLGIVAATQNYTKIPLRIRSNMKYIFTFNNPTDANNICNIYNLDKKEWGTKIKELPKHVCLAYTTERFLVYDMDGNSYYSNGPFIGKSLPPLSIHQKPKGGK